MKKIRVGVIPAAGKGSRINDLPLTRVLPKPMLPLLDKPLIEYVIENMKRLGIETIYMVVGHKKELLKGYFGNGKDWSVDIDYVEQERPRGIAHAISLVESQVEEPFVTILGDDFTVARSLNNITEAFWKNKAWAVEGVVIERDIEILRRTCCLSIDKNGKITSIDEKPDAPCSTFRGCGIYVFDPIIFDYIKETSANPLRNEKEITDTLDLVQRRGKAFAAFVDGINININRLEDFEEAIRFLLNLNLDVSTMPRVHDKPRQFQVIPTTS
jgi:dTDP-glucose pyrophosphorylase